MHLEKHHWRYLGLPGVGLRSCGADAVLSGQAGEHSRGVQRGRVVRRLGADHRQASGEACAGQSELRRLKHGRRRLDRRGQLYLPRRQAGRSHARHGQPGIYLR